MRTPNKILVAVGTIGASVGIGHNVINNHDTGPTKVSGLEIKADAPTISLDEYLGKNATRHAATHTEPATHTTEAISPAPSEISVPASTPSPAAEQKPASITSKTHKDKPAESIAVKDGQDTSSDPSTKPSSFEAIPTNNGDDESSGDGSGDDGEGDGSYGDSGDGKAPSSGGPGEMAPADPSTSAPNTTQTPENDNPYLGLAQEFSSELFSNDPGNPRRYFTGEMRVQKPGGTNFNIRNGLYHLYQTKDGPVLLVGYHALKGGGEDPKGHLGYEVFDGVDAISSVEIFPDDTGKAPIQPALRESISLLYENNDRPGVFVGQYGIELGGLDNNEPTGNASHLVIRDGNVALEPLDYTGVK